ncbi:aspartate aminotransferase [Carbonactinospora thermoautotrophica]|uniref:Aspartate aminotransferase n=1 Tax=Carbonactinospora thermoautotrophica TaxID=1469144 RepID=A0A132MV75_9ACTN|nr:aminotransferase class I/II-fold pyridoxal phosphate-dependent enzyme [Carbonactinospora thermoautotrophica]KWX01610.1 Aspartate aminotransferase [Carbonactinospora thermoautotrophica]MCX9190784.1 aspartate aminotransferase [Carbonactinospora thermoautotrophica]
MPSTHRGSDRLLRLHLPERADQIGQSVRAADQVLREHADDPTVLDTTHFDTVRFPAPDWALETFAAAARDGSLAYTGYAGHPAVRAAVAASAATFTGFPVEPDNVVITPGTQAALFAALAATVDTGAPVAVVDPDYLFNARILRFLDADVRYIPLTAEESGPNLDLHALEDAFAAGARTLVFSNPNNPTGAVYPRAILERIADLARAADALVVVDALYSRLVYDTTAYTHLRSLPGMADRCVTLLGPSKTESLSGYRIGVAIAPQPVAAGIEDVLSTMALRAPAYAQHLLTRWLVDDHAWVAARVEELRALRDHTVKRLSELDWIRLHPQQGTAYLFPDVSRLGLTDQEVATALLREAKVMVSPGYQFGPRGVGSFRVCYARDEEQWDAALTRIVEVLDKLATGRGR